MENGKDMKMGEFRGKVLTHLDYLKDAQDAQSVELKAIKDSLDTHIKKSGKAIAVLKYVTGVCITWLGTLTGVIIKFWR